MELKVAESQIDFFNLMHIRSSVFVNEQQVPIDIELDAQDYQATHLLLMDGAIPVGCCRIITQGRTAHLGRIAIDKAYRHQGLGRLLMEKTEVYVTQHRYQQIDLNAQIQAQGFYEALGYHSIGDIFSEANIDHVRMVKAIEDSSFTR